MKRKRQATENRACELGEANALAGIHDLRASDGEKIIETIKSVREFFKSGPITIHLILDVDISDNDETFRHLKKEVDNKQLEIVFHGVTHLCPEGTGKLFSWYHKRLRLVVHTIDLSNIDSITFFRNKYYKLISKGFSPVLQNEMV